MISYGNYLKRKSSHILKVEAEIKIHVKKRILKLKSLRNALN